jgi:N-acetyl-gamma-glutamyl-phosphate reductase
VFLALPDHAAAEVAPPLVARGKRVFDLSGAFRLRDAELRQRWYPKTPDRAGSVVYGLTERTAIGCATRRSSRAPAAIRRRRFFAAAAAARACSTLSGAPIIIDAKSGVSGAGKTPTSARTSASATAACRPTASFESPPRRRDRAGARHGRSRSCRTCCRSTAGILETIYATLKPGVDEAAVPRRCTRPYADSPFVRSPARSCPRSSTSRTRTSATSAGR